jgi:D-3-phosphoglycerate dehydrogenase
MKKNFWLINTARGSAVITKDLVKGLKSRKILGAGLDVLEYESSSFENIFQTQKNNTDFSYLLNSENVILSPHVGGWTMESHEKLAKIISEKIITTYKK